MVGDFFLGEKKNFASNGAGANGARTSFEVEWWILISKYLLTYVLIFYALFDRSSKVGSQNSTSKIEKSKSSFVWTHSQEAAYLFCPRE